MYLLKKSKPDSNTRGILKVISMVFYLSIRFTNPIMLGIIFKSYISTMFWHKFPEDINADMKNIIVNKCTVYILEDAKFQWKI